MARTNVRFHESLYTREGLDQAISDWAEVGTFDVVKEEGYHVVALSSLKDGELSEDNVAEVLGEFQNYVLGVEVQKRR